ncbi:hypothetical protein FRC07_009028 [Ceratobasidium sp. 392]|nr:hypothetical protein FRC07_009028 [Ceratobasidium sp. 392]
MSSPNDPPKDSSKRIGILKGGSVKDLMPLVLIKLPPKTTNLRDMRSMLARFKYMSATDSFLDPSGFPIHHEDEKGVSTVEALQGHSSDGSGSPDAKSHGAKFNRPIKFEYLCILSSSMDEETKDPERVNYAQTPHDDDTPTGGEIPKSQIDSSNIPKPPKAKPSKDVGVNAKTLNKKEIDDVFEINNVFGGMSFIGPIGACSQIFDSPTDLSSMIYVYDDSSLEIQEFESSTMNSMFRQGAWGISGKLGFKGLSLAGGVSGDYSYEKRTKKGFKYTTGVYRYSRAVIRLPIANLQPTEKFQNELAAAFAAASPELKKARLSDFFAQYGQAFAFEVQLGGHLYTTGLLAEEDEKTKESAASKVQAGFALDFGLGKSLGISGKREKKSGGEHEEHYKYADLVVEAVGGDTLLSSDLELWPSSVMPHTNWRITRRANVQALIDIPSLFSKERRDEVVNLFGPFDKSLPLVDKEEAEKLVEEAENIVKEAQTMVTNANNLVGEANKLQGEEKKKKAGEAAVAADAAVKKTDEAVRKAEEAENTAEEEVKTRAVKAKAGAQKVKEDAKKAQENAAEGMK